MGLKIFKIIIAIFIVALCLEILSKSYFDWIAIILILFLLLLIALVSKAWKISTILSVIIGMLGVIASQYGELAGAAILFCSIPFIVIPVVSWTFYVIKLLAQKGNDK